MTTRVYGYTANQTIKVPTDVCEGGIAHIVGYEWGPDNRLTGPRSEGWVYFIKLPGVGQAYRATEEEITKWQGESK